MISFVDRSLRTWLQALDDWLRTASAVRIAGIGSFLAFALWTVLTIGTSGFGNSSEPSREVARGGSFAPDQNWPAGQAQIADSTDRSRREINFPVPSKVADFRQSVFSTQTLILVEELNRTRQYLEKLERKRQEWESLRPELLEGDLGRPLAANSEELPKLVVLLNQADQLTPSSNHLRRQFDEFVNVLDVHNQSGLDLIVPKQSHDGVKEICQEIRTNSTKLEGVIIAIRKLIDAPYVSDATGLTLQEAITEYHAEEARQEAEVTVAAKLQAKQEMADRLRAAEQEIAESEVRLRLARLSAEAERNKGEEELARAEATKKKEEDKARRQRTELEADFARDQAEIQSLLSPFVSLAQHTLYPPNNHLYSGQSTGVSLSAISKFGAMEPTIEGIDAMSQLGQTTYRPLGSFPKYVQSEWKRSPDVRRRLERAQALLLKYGELLVEKGMLEK